VPKAKSKKQQRFFWGVLVKQGKMTSGEARKRSVRGKAYKRLPTRKRKTRARSRRKR
jgi:hypothetical protein